MQKIRACRCNEIQRNFTFVRVCCILGSSLKPNHAANALLFKTKERFCLVLTPRCTLSNRGLCILVRHPGSCGRLVHTSKKVPASSNGFRRKHRSVRLETLVRPSATSKQISTSRRTFLRESGVYRDVSDDVGRV